jgi:hypothetical protein
MICVIALAIAACGGNGGESATEDSTTTTGAAATTTAAPETTTTTEATTTTTTQPTTTTTSAPSADECLVGAWELDSEAFLTQMGDAFAEEMQGQQVEVTYVGGTYLVTMAEGGRFTGERNEWSFEFGTPEGAFRITIDGIDGGLWETDGDTLVLSDLESASTVTAQAVVDGELVDLPGGVVPDVESDAVGNRSSFECLGAELIVTPEDGFPARFERVDG